MYFLIVRSLNQHLLKLFSWSLLIFPLKLATCLSIQVALICHIICLLRNLYSGVGQRGFHIQIHDRSNLAIYRYLINPFGRFVLLELVVQLILGEIFPLSLVRPKRAIHDAIVCS